MSLALFTDVIAFVIYFINTVIPACLPGMVYQIRYDGFGNLDIGL
jgi:hypothetical protein